MSMTIYTKQVAETKVADKYTLHVKTKAPAPTLPNDFIRLFVVSKNVGMEARNEQFNSGKAAIGTGLTSSSPGSRRAIWFSSASTAIGARSSPGRR